MPNQGKRKTAAPKTIIQEHSANFATLQRAFRSGDVGLVECQLESTGEKVAVICAFAGDADGSVTFTPFAMFFNGNPYELLNPPDPDGGFHTTPADTESAE